MRLVVLFKCVCVYIEYFHRPGNCLDFVLEIQNFSTGLVTLVCVLCQCI